MDERNMRFLNLTPLIVISLKIGPLSSISPAPLNLIPICARRACASERPCPECIYFRTGLASNRGQTDNGTLGGVRLTYCLAWPTTDRDAAPARFNDRLCAARHVQSTKNGDSMALHRSFGESKLPADVFGRHPSQQAAEHVHLSRGEPDVGVQFFGRS